MQQDIPQKNTAAMKWAATIEADQGRGVEIVSKEAKTKTVADMVD